MLDEMYFVFFKSELDYYISNKMLNKKLSKIEIRKLYEDYNIIDFPKKGNVKSNLELILINKKLLKNS